MTHICFSNLTITGSDNGLSPGWHQTIIWINAQILLIGPSGTNVSEILIKILIFSFTKMCLNVLSAKWGPFYLGLSVLNGIYFVLASVYLQNWFDTVCRFSLTHNIFQCHFPTRILSNSPNLSISSRGSGIFDLLSWTHKMGHITQVTAILAPFLSNQFSLMDRLRNTWKSHSSLQCSPYISMSHHLKTVGSKMWTLDSLIKLVPDALSFGQDTATQLKIRY